MKNIISPPIAKKQPKELSIHNDVRIDNYYWLNDKENPEVIDYLNAENKYTKCIMEHTEDFQKEVEETKKRLDTVLIDEKSNDDLLKVTLSANRQIKSITIDDELLADKEQLEDYLVLTLNKAIEKATSVNEAELSAVAKEGMPNIPGMDMFK